MLSVSASVPGGLAAAKEGGPGLAAGGSSGSVGLGPVEASERPRPPREGGVVLPILDGGGGGRVRRGVVLRAGDGCGPPRVRPVDPRGRPTLTLVTANVNSWATMKFWVETLDADVLLLQETRVAQDGLAAAQAQGRDAGWAGVWEPAVSGGRGGPASGGLAILARGGRRVAKVPVVGKFSHRWLHAVVEADQGKPLHVVSVYGFDSGQPEAAGRNAALFQEIFEAMAGLGATQWVVGGDWNEESSAIWTLVAAEGRGLLLPRAPEGDGPVERGTCEPGGRRIDFFVASPALAGRVGVETVLREAPLQPHKPVSPWVARLRWYRCLTPPSPSWCLMIRPRWGRSPLGRVPGLSAWRIGRRA